MVDLTKHLERAKQALDRNNFDIAIGTLEDCIDVGPDNIEVYRLLIDAARKKAKVSGKPGLFGGMTVPSFSKDPHKQFVAAAKRIAKSPDAKALAEAGDAANRLYQSGIKSMVDVAIYLYEQMRTTGLFNDKVLWNLGHLYMDKVKASGAKDRDSLDKALRTMTELDRAMPSHAEAGKVIKNWEAMKSMMARTDKQTGSGSFTDQVKDLDASKRAEAINKMVRTEEDARNVLHYIDQELAVRPEDKDLWTKRGDIHFRFARFAEARAAFEKAQSLDVHDFTLTMRLGDLRVRELEALIAAAKGAGRDHSALDRQLVEEDIAEYRKRVERQPTDMNHRFNLGVRLFKADQIEAAAAEFQRSVGDPNLKRKSHRLLGACFYRKKLLDLARQQYDSYLQITDDDTADEAKDVRYTRARILEQLGRRDEAITDYNRLVTVDLGYKDAADRLNSLQLPPDEETASTSTRI